MNLPPQKCLLNEGAEITWEGRLKSNLHFVSLLCQAPAGLVIQRTKWEMREYFPQSFYLDRAPLNPYNLTKKMDRSQFN